MGARRTANGFPRCEGFGDQEGRCLNAAVTPARIWCWSCEDKRRAHITAQMETVTRSFAPALSDTDGEA